MHAWCQLEPKANKQHCKFFTFLGEDGRSKKSASAEPPKKAESSELPSKEKSSTPDPLDTATGESSGAQDGEAKKLTDQKEANKGEGSGEGEQATMAEQQDQEQHGESSEEPGV